MEDAGYEVSESGFFSPVERAVVESPRAAGNKQAWLNALRKTEGVTDELLTAHKIDDVLGPQSVDKATLLSHVRDTKPVIEHIVRPDVDPAYEIRQERPKLPAYRVERDDNDPSAYRVTLPGGFALRATHPTREAAQAAADRQSELDAAASPDVHAVYREGERTRSYRTPEEAQAAVAGTGTAKFGPTTHGAYSTHGGTNYREHLLTLRPPDDAETEPYRSSHFDEPNVLAHLRTQDFDQDGKKTLLLDEVQSDWHQAGREHGYQSHTAQKALEAHREELAKRAHAQIKQDLMTGEPEGFDHHGIDPYVMPADKAHRLAGRTTAHMSHSDMAKYLHDQKYPELYAAAMAEFDRNDKAVPDAPFKNTWHQLALKKALQIAAREGYDRLALTTGDTQNKRYRLSNHVASLEYVPTDRPGGLGEVVGYDDEGNEKISHPVADASEVHALVGKELGERLLKHGRVAGPDLEVGGAGMKKWYDDILPSVLDKIGRRYGARVGKSELHTGEHHYELEHEPREGEDPDDIPSRRVPVTQTVHHLDITPELRRAVLGGVGYAEGGAVEQARSPHDPRIHMAEGGKVEHPMIEVDGEMRHRHNANGHPIHPTEEGIRNFHRWFGASKTVDEHGRPLVMYHGTGADIKAFDPKMAYTGEGASHSGSGHYFTSSPEQASNYAALARTKNGAGNVLPVYLAHKKPLPIDWEHGEGAGAGLTLTRPQVRKIIMSVPNIRSTEDSPLLNFGDIGYEGFDKVLNGAINSYAGHNNIAALRNDFFNDDHQAWLDSLRNATGYDSAVTHPTPDVAHHVSWRPEQIKSALGNQGTFGPNEPDITKATGGLIHARKKHV